MKNASIIMIIPIQVYQAPVVLEMILHQVQMIKYNNNKKRLLIIICKVKCIVRKQ